MIVQSISNVRKYYGRNG